MLNVTIHRGTNEVGASCVEISNNDSKLIVDVGSPLDDSPSSLPKNISNTSGVLISHPHQDHFGLLDQINAEIPVHIGELSLSLINASRLFQKKERLNCNFKVFKSWQSFEVGTFKITPYLVDHSAADSYSFIISSEGKSIFYSGDFRAHGRKKVLFDNLIKRPPHDIDLLILEGTMLERNNNDFPTEDDVETGILNVLKNNNISFLICSGQNIDRIVSAYRASKRANRIFVLDIYTAWILDVFSKYFSSTPCMDWDNVRVLTNGRQASSHYSVMKKHPKEFKEFTNKLFNSSNIEIKIDELANNPEKYLIKTNDPFSIKHKMNILNADIIYSMWPGYLTTAGNKQLHSLYKLSKLNPDTTFNIIHTSGHATLQSLEKLSQAIKPKMIIPIHTEHKANYKDYFDNVILLDDGQSISI